VVLDRLDHHVGLRLGRRHLHAAGAADAGVRDVAVAGDLVRGVDDHHALAELVGEHARRFAQQRGLAHARPAQQQHAAAGLHQVADNGDCAEHSAAHAAGEADHGATAVADGRDTVQRARDARAVILAEGADAVGHVVEVLARYVVVAEKALGVAVARLGQAAKVHHDLDQLARIRLAAEQRSANMGGQRLQQQVDIAS
jgi:hypothetical protein